MSMRSDDIAVCKCDEPMAMSILGRCGWCSGTLRTYLPAVVGVPKLSNAERAVSEIRELIHHWGDGDRARLIRSVLDRYGV